MEVPGHGASTGFRIHRVGANRWGHVGGRTGGGGAEVGRHARIRREIVDKDVKIPQNMTIGYDLAEDRRRGFTVTEQGIVVLAKAELPESFAAGY